MIKKIVGFTLTAIILVGCNNVSIHNKPAFDDATFTHFQYQGKDPLFSKPLAEGEYQNPIAAGFYPDPSIVRVGDEFYMVNSSFSYFPGIPIHRSTNLVDWEPLGYVLTRESQLKLTGASVSRGIYAPTIRYHEGTFYVITTGVDGAGGNFVVTATDPAGEWSDPYYLPEIDGIDPSIFFDEDGRTYITHNGPPIGEPLYNGHRAIWKWEFDLSKMQVVPNSGKVIVNGGVDLSKKPVWVEGPHLYKINGWYYLMCAEGGTAESHSEVVFRSRSLEQPFEAYTENPILTQRDLDTARESPIATAGHADMVQLDDGSWWAVFLATRNYQQHYFNTGRETFLLPVSWKDGWPVILAAGEAIPYRQTAPKGLDVTVNAQALTGNIIHRDKFDSGRLGWQWNMLRGGDSSWMKLKGNGGLSLTPNSVKLSQLEQPVFVGRRQQNLSYRAEADMVAALSESVHAGVTVFQSEQAHYFFYLSLRNGEYWLSVDMADKPVTAQKLGKLVDTKQIKFIVEGDKGELSLSYQLESGSGWSKVLTLANKLDATVLSTQKAGGFVGSYIGMHARIIE